MKKKEIIVIRKYCLAHNNWQLTLPGGKIKPGENARESATRELIEETNYAPSNLQLLVKLDILPVHIVGKTYIFLANNLKTSTQFEKEKHELLSVVPLSEKEARKMIKHNKITDARSVASLLYYFTYSPSSEK